MSLVNDMLNDLDDRRVKRANDEVNLDWMTGQKENKKNRTILPLLWVLGLLVLLFIAYQFWLMNSNSNTTPLDYLAAREDTTGTELDNRLTVDQSVDNTVGIMQAVVAEKVVQPNVPVKKQIEKNSSAIIAQDHQVETVNSSTVKASSTIENKSVPITGVVTTSLKKETPKAFEYDQPGKKQLIKQKPSLTIEQIDKQYAKEAEALIKMGQIKAAENQLQSYLQSNPQAINSGKLLASIFLSSNKFSQAEQLIDRLRKIYPDNINLISNQARVYLQTNRASQAVDLLMAAKPRLENNTAFYELLGLAARQNNQYQLSLQAYRGLLDVDSSRGDWWVGMAIALDQNGEFSRARDAYRQGLNSNGLTTTLRQYARQRLAVL